MLKTVKLYGELGRKYGKLHRLDVANALDAIRAFCAMIPGFQQDFARLSYRVVQDNYFVSSKDELELPAHEIRFIPVAAGAGHGWGEVLLGAALIVASFYIPGAALTMGASQGFAAAAGSMAFSLGASMVLTGVGQLLAPAPPTPQYSNSFLFNGPVNTAKQGTPVPVLYGRLKIGSFVASASVRSYNIAIGPATTNTGATSTTLSNGSIVTTNQSIDKGQF